MKAPQGGLGETTALCQEDEMDPAILRMEGMELQVWIASFPQSDLFLRSKKKKKDLEKL